MIGVPQIASLQNLSTCIEKDELYIMMELVDTDLHRLIQSKTKLEEAHIAYACSLAEPFPTHHSLFLSRRQRYYVPVTVWSIGTA
jgi:hypothetical protein